MKAEYFLQDPYTSPAMRYHLLVTLIPETVEEAFGLGMLAIQLRGRDVWCTLDQNKATLTVQVHHET
jgi:hypothetical protein